MGTLKKGLKKDRNPLKKAFKKGLLKKDRNPLKKAFKKG